MCPDEPPDWWDDEPPPRPITTVYLPGDQPQEAQ